MSAAIKPASVPGAVATESATQPETPLPNSRRIYIEGTQPGVCVAFREIDQNATRNLRNELEENPPVRVYDTSGPYGDPSVRTDVREGLAQLRREWIVVAATSRNTKARDSTDRRRLSDV
jgi:phosphomethylpyrimidine synthase